MTRSAYIQSGPSPADRLPDGSNFSGAVLQRPTPPRRRRGAYGGRIYESRPEYTQRFWGIEFQATKRLSDSLDGAHGVLHNTHTEHFGDMSKSIVDPNPAPRAAD